jgi:hypothetical protein
VDDHRRSCFSVAPHAKTNLASRRQPENRMANGDERDPESQQLSRKRRARLAALLIVLLVAGWLWLLWMIR